MRVKDWVEYTLKGGTSLERSYMLFGCGNRRRNRMKLLLILLVTLGVNQALQKEEVVEENAMGYLECSEDADVCVFEFNIQQHTSMTTKEGEFVYVDEERKLYAKGKEGPTEIPVDHYKDIIILDGYYRLVLTVNGKIPGPHIVVYKGQKVKINVVNNLLSDTLSIHWHGIHQKGTPWMDGIAWINQCPIAAGQSFTYEFDVPVVGTYWYHSHVGVQRTDGIYGGFVVKEKKSTYRADDRPPIDIIMTVGEWEHEMANEMFDKSYTDTGEELRGYIGGLIEGRGRYWNSDETEIVEAPLKRFKVKKIGETYRFRVIHVGSFKPFRISIDGHTLEVIATDGFDIDPISAESFIINSGERYDFILKDLSQKKNSWIRVEPVTVNKTGLLVRSKKYIRAVLEYEDADTDPEDNDKDCTESSPCSVVNCQLATYKNIECQTMKSAVISEHPVPSWQSGQEIFINFGFPYGSEAAANGFSFAFPNVNSLTQTEQVEKDDNVCPDEATPTTGKCYHEVAIEAGKATVQLVLSSLGSGSGSHPIHLHGHSFHVLKVAYGEEDASGKLEDNKDIDCNDAGCTKPKWANDWSGDQIGSGANLVDPFIKDTIYIPKHGYAVVRFAVDNPGKWIIHCHIDSHLALGMAVVLSERITEVTPPQGLPICSDFYNDVTKDYKIKNTPPDTSLTVYQILAISFGVVIIFFITFTGVLLFKIRSLKHNATPTESTGLLIRNTNA